MGVSVTELRLWRSWKESKLLSVCAVYADSFTAARGVEFCQNLSRHLGADCQMQQHVWFFSELLIPQLRGIAAGEAAMADVVVVSAHHGQALPESVKAWLEQWLAWHGRKSTVLAALLDPPVKGSNHSVENFLEDLAKRGDLEFMLVSEELSVEH